MCTPPPVGQGRPPRRRDPNAPATRRHRVVELMTANPPPGWTGRELAERLQVPPRNMLTQLAEWTRLGFLTRTGAGIYTLATPT
jgi:DNA-binding IclR family transcriptional regulator